MNTERKFNFNWFDGQVPLFNHFLGEYKGLDNLKFLEIGSFEGKSTCWMLDNILTGKNCKISCLDSWAGGFEHKDIKMKDIEDNFLSNVSSRSSDVEIIKGLSHESLMSIFSRKNQYDFIYVDGGHTAKDVVLDAFLSFPLLKPGGMMAFDDYPWGSQEFPPDKRPQIGIDCFLISHASEIEIIHKDYQVWVKRK